jgi:hypothetical protein
MGEQRRESAVRTRLLLQDVSGNPGKQLDNYPEWCVFAPEDGLVGDLQLADNFRFGGPSTRRRSTYEIATAAWANEQIACDVGAQLGSLPEG